MLAHLFHPLARSRRVFARRPRAVVCALAVATLTASAVLVAPAAGAAAPRAAAAEPQWLDQGRSADERASALVGQLSLVQKVTVIDQNSGTGVPQFGIPPIRSIDGCCGITGTVPTTAMPVGIALASSFSNEFAREYGQVLGREGWLTGFNSVAGPTMDLTRTPFNGRMWESFGEDVHLNGMMAAGQVAGEQEQDVWAIPKHYNLNLQETRRGHVSSQVDERTLHEVYLAPWERMVRDSSPGAVMCSFNRINDVYGCSNAELLQRNLKDRIGFRGYVTSDFDAFHGFGDYAAGLDVSGPTETYAGAALVEAVHDGVVSETRVTDAAFRVLRTMIETGVYDNPPPGALTVPTPPQPRIAQDVLGRHNAIAARIGDATSVLLKNAGGALPLTDDGGQMALIGPDADYYIAGGGAGAVTVPNDVTTVLEALQDRAGENDMTVSYSAGTDSLGLGDTLPGPAPVPSAVLSPNDGSDDAGLAGEYFANRTFQGTPTATRNDTQINIRSGIGADFSTTSRDAGIGAPFYAAGFAGRWTGQLTAPTTGEYELSLSHLGTARLWIDDEQLISDPAQTYSTQTATVSLTAGEPVDVRIEYVTDAPEQFNGGLNDQPGPMLRFGWTPPAGAQPERIQAAVAAAQNADVAVVVARDYTSEGSDRGTLTLPQDQNRLISAVAAANPRTVVVLATSGPVLMPWLDDVDAVLETWYGGQVQGRTVARTLFGDVNPSGKLPVTFPASQDQVDEIGAENPFRQINEINPVQEFTEGVFLGYKAYDRADLTPLFPFGHGLSYTSFRYSGLKVQPTASGLTATFTVTNTGSRKGTEAAQVYAGRPAPTQVDMPERSLVGFKRVTLDPGESASVSVPVSTRDLSYWSTADDNWRLPSGARAIEVGASSRDIRLTARNATAGVFSPRFSRIPDRNGWYRKPVVVTGQLSAVGGGGTCSRVRYAGPDGRNRPVTITCTANGVSSRHVVRVNYDATAPRATVRRPAAPTRPKSWRTVRGTIRAGAGSPVADVRVKAVQRRGSTWYAFRNGKWRRSTSAARALGQAELRGAKVSGTRWSVRLPGVTRGRLAIRVRATDRAGNVDLARRSQQLR
nr:beta-glucosidase [Aeromicrobium duanguangcaii]